MSLAPQSKDLGRTADLPLQGPDPYIFMRPTPRAPVHGPLLRPRAKEGISALTVGLVVASVVMGLLALAQWAWQRAAQADRAALEAARPPIPLPVPAKLPEPVAAPEGVRRCASAVGEVTYSDAPCPAGTQETLVNTTTDATNALQLESAVGSATLYRCKGAGQFWSIVHCQHRGAWVVGTHAVPVGLSLADQIAFAQQPGALNRPVLRKTEVGPPPPLSAAQQKANDCRRLDLRIAALDAYTRQVLSVGEQDRVRGERRSYRDQQFRLRCGR